MTKPKNFHFVAVSLIVLPLIVYWGYTSYISYNYPHEAFDPEYAYFLTSLAPFKGVEYSYIDHPGTPVEIIGSIFLGTTYPFVSAGGASGFIQYHLNDPQLFLILSHGFLLLASILCAVYFYRIATSERTWESALVASSLALMFYVIHPLALVTLRFWTHNSFNFPFGCLLLLFLYRTLQQNGEISKKNILLLGLSAGILTAVVVYFGVWMIGIAVTMIVFYRAQGMAFKKILITITLFGAACFAGFIGAVLPVLNQAPKFIAWIGAIITHQGIYGRGDAGVASVSSLVSNFWLLYQVSPLLFLALGASFIFIVIGLIQWRSKISQKPGLFALSIGLSLQILISTIVVVKHPGPFYSLSIAAEIPVLVLTIKGLFFDDRPFLRKMFNRVLIVLTVIGFASSLIASTQSQKTKIDEMKTLDSNIAQIVSKREAMNGLNMKKIVTLWGQGILTSCKALTRMNRNYVHAFSAELTKTNACKNQYALNDDGIIETITANPLFALSAPLKINTAKWDFIVVQHTNVAKLIQLLGSNVDSENLNGMNAEISVIYHK